ncbi:tectonic-like complex member MKS1 [Symsagittifera roscoffensis]|uniref:tectonic-like complex member MKS1 n=1 Tax=Symsagittifera roscoffensis TaxID=84072 RepID=UPI00307BB5E1
MLGYRSGEKQNAHYRSKDPIGNLKIKVTLKKLTAASVFNTGDGAESETGTKLSAKEKFLELQQGAKSEVEELVVSFCEKKFSHREVTHYAAIQDGDLQEGDHFKEMRKKCSDEFGGDPDKRPNRRLFTYVPGDKFVETVTTSAMTTDEKEQPSYLANKMSDIRLADSKENGDVNQNEANETSKKSEPTFVGGRKVVEEPSESLKEQTHYLKQGGTTFHVIADLTRPGMEHLQENEYPLCSINMSSAGVITVSPDFNRHRPPYSVVSDLERREVYEYTIEHVSKEITAKEKLREQKVVNDIYLRHQEHKTKAIGNQFELPQPGVLRVNCFGEIVSAKDFEYDGLYVQYYLDIPMCWWADPNSCQITGVTQRCNKRVAPNGKDEVSNFGFPMEFELFFRNDSEDSDGIHSEWPTLFIEVLSIDQWLRFRTEGYGWVKLPATPGVIETEVSCWRPLGNGSLSSELRRFFVGGSPELEDIAFVSKPTSQDGVVLSKYGMMTEATGSVKLRFNTIMQSQLFLDKEFQQERSKKKTTMNMIDRLGGHSMQQTVQSVLDTFIKTRNKLRAAREGVLK